MKQCVWWRKNDYYLQKCEFDIFLEQLVNPMNEDDFFHEEFNEIFLLQNLTFTKNKFAKTTIKRSLTRFLVVHFTLLETMIKFLQKKYQKNNTLH